MGKSCRERAEKDSGRIRSLAQQGVVMSNSEMDGSSFEKAIVIDKDNSMDGVQAEYAWLNKYYPGYKIKKQRLTFDNNKPYDVIEIITADGVEKAIHFDITKFFGKF